MTPQEFLARAAHYHLGIAGARRDSSFLGEPPAEWPRALTVALGPAAGRRSSMRRSPRASRSAQLLARISLQLAADLDSGRAAARIWAAADWAEVALAGDDGSCVELPQCSLKGSAAAVMQAVHRALGLADSTGDLARRETRYMAQHEHLALVLRQAVKASRSDCERSKPTCS